MKIISLNLWCGTLYEPLMELIREKGKDTDIFCFQEVIFGGDEGPITKHKIRGRLFEELKKALPDHIGYERFGLPGSRFGETELPSGARIGQAIFVRASFEVNAEGGGLLYSGDPFHGNIIGGCTGNFNYVRAWGPGFIGRPAMVGNVHGLWQQHKQDTPERLDQSRRLLEYFNPHPELCRVLMGDFNIAPNTESIAMISKYMKNLITEYGIKTTRTSYYKDMEKWKDYIADYAFVGSDVQVKDFKVLPDVVSDHLALQLEI